MKLIWHIIRKDISHHRWALLVWALLYIAQMGLGFYMLQVDHPNLEEAAWLQWGNWLLVFVQFATGYLLVSQFVQGDELTGTRMFWLTRPISTRRLFAAKVLGVVLIFAVGPVLLLLPWWLYCDFGARDIGWAAFEALSWQLLMIAPAFLIAALTDDLGRLIMWTLLLITGLLAWAIWVQSGLKTSLIGPAPSENSGLMFSRLWLAAAVLAVGAVMITIHQFLTRRFVRSVTLTVSVLGLVVLIGRFWPWDCTILFTEIAQPKPALLASDGAFAALQLTLKPAQVRFHEKGVSIGQNGQKVEEPRTVILEMLEVQGVRVHEDLMISTRMAVQFWHWPDGPASTTHYIYFESRWDRALRHTLALPKQQDDPETVHWQQERREKDNADRVARGLAPLPAWPRLVDDGSVMSGYTRLPDSLVARIQAQAPASELRVEAEVGRPQILLELPLRAGARGSGDSQTFRITSLFHPREGEGATAQIVLTSPALRSSGLWGVLAINPASRDPLPEHVVAVNHTEGDYWSAFLRYAEGGEPVKARVGGVKIRWTICGVSSPRVVRNGEWTARYLDWFEHANLVMYVYQPLARFTREVKVEKFELEPDTTTKPASDKSF